MSLSQLWVENFRNLQTVELTPAAGINVIFGDNAAGKTSLLEAIHFLGRARSFRTTKREQLIRRGAEALLVRATVTDQLGIAARVGVQRSADVTRVRIDGEDVRSLSTLARWFPVQVINAESQRLLQDGPKVRRSFVNWSVFHVEQDYYGHWRRYERALKQRNAALRLGDARMARALEPELVLAGEAITQLRRSFVDRLWAAAQPLLERWLPEEELSVAYRPGWAGERSLAEAFEEGRTRELESGHSLYGPQRADVMVRSAGMEAQHRLSRGQQKLLSIALLLADAALLKDQGRQREILLIDDLPAELDLNRREQVLEVLQQVEAQAFVTCTDRDAIPLRAGQAKWFHVEHGVYHEVI